MPSDRVTGGVVLFGLGISFTYYSLWTLILVRTTRWLWAGSALFELIFTDCSSLCCLSIIQLKDSSLTPSGPFDSPCFSLLQGSRLPCWSSEYAQTDVFAST